MVADPMNITETILTVMHKHGLHARPADLFVRTCNQFSSIIEVSNLTSASRTVNAKSILGVLSLGVQCNHSIKITAKGPDNQEAITALTNLIQNDFSE